MIYFNMPVNQTIRQWGKWLNWLYQLSDYNNFTPKLLFEMVTIIFLEVY